MKQALYSQLKEIKDEEIKSFVKNVLDKSDEGFWKIPCSMSGQWHPPENQGEAGNIRHLIKCITIGKKLCAYFDLQENDRDIVLASIILHDIKKHGEPWGEKTDYCHGKIGADFLDKFNLREPEKTEIKNCVKYHMGRFTGVKEDIIRAEVPTKKELIVQMSDYFSSLKEASWLPGVNIKQEDIDKFLK